MSNYLLENSSHDPERRQPANCAVTRHSLKVRCLAWAVMATTSRRFAELIANKRREKYQTRVTPRAWSRVSRVSSDRLVVSHRCHFCAGEIIGNHADSSFESTDLRVRRWWNTSILISYWCSWSLQFNSVSFSVSHNDGIWDNGIE